MNMKLFLTGNQTYSWYHHNGMYFIGYLIDQDQSVYRERDALQYISEQLIYKTPEAVFSELDGSFAYIQCKEDAVNIMSDAVNFFPIFYTEIEEQWNVSDSWETLVQLRGDFEINEEAEDEYQNAGFVLGNETLHATIYKNNAGEILAIHQHDIHHAWYQQFTKVAFLKSSFSDLADKAFEEFLNCGRQMLAFLNGRTAVVPLSGGYDSRLIVSLLKYLQYEKVICFTYGKYNSEVPISKEVAKTLGYEWYFIDYSQIDVETVRRQGHFSEYLDYAANGFAMTYLMEYFAVHELKKQQLLPDDAVFLPGHSGDFLGGSYVLKTVKNNWDVNQLPRHLARNYFFLRKQNSPTKKQLQRRIQSSIKEYDVSVNANGYNRMIEDWDIREKLAKVIFNSSHVFNWFGYEHYFPLWTVNLRQFYSSVPLRYRENKQLYDYVAHRFFFRPQNVSFGGQELAATPRRVFIQKWKDKVRYRAPWYIVLKKINQADWPYYQKLADWMLKSVKDKNGKRFKNFKNYNAVVCAWYVHHVQEKYSVMRGNKQS